MITIENYPDSHYTHHTILDWYFAQTRDTLWLGTAYHTRAEKIYRKAGWTEAGTNGPKEIRFDMTFDQWHSASNR